MLALHDDLPSQNCWKVRVLLGLLAIAYRSKPVSIFEGESRAEACRAMNPIGASIPTPPSRADRICSQRNRKPFPISSSGSRVKVARPV
jgi:hypothetical protein